MKKKKNMLETNITEAANIFIWIVCLGIGFVAGLIALDTYKPKEKDKTETSKWSTAFNLIISTDTYILTHPQGFLN